MTVKVVTVGQQGPPGPTGPAGPGSAQVIYGASIFVASGGGDDNDGSPLEPKYSIGAAITAAEAEIAGGQRTVQVFVQDAGVYTEDLAISDGVHVYAPTATLIGTVTLGNDASLTVNRHYAAAPAQTLVQKGDGAGHGFYRANVLDTRGIDADLIDGIALRNVSNGSVLFATVGVLYVAQGGVGVSDGASGFGHIHFWTPDLYLAGNNAVGISAANNSNFIGYIDHILEIGSPTGTTALRLTHSGASVKVTVTEVIAGTAYNITNGALHIVCSKLTGTRTGTPACELSNVALIGAWGTKDAVTP